MKVKIYHNPRCTKSRQGLAYLQEKGIEAEVIEYLKHPIRQEELAEIIQQLGITPLELVRKTEEEYKSHFKDQDLSNEQWIEAMVQYPKLIERPIVVANGKAVIGRPTEKIDEII